MEFVLAKYPGAYALKVQSYWCIGNGQYGVIGHGNTQIDAWTMARDRIVAERFAEALTI